MKIEKAFKRLLIKSPFYGLFCLSLPKVITTKVDTLAVSKSGINCQLNINPDFWEQFTDDEQIALLEHELSHIALQHMFMADSFPNPKYFNIAADAEVNSYIENLPEGGVTAKLLSQTTGIHLENGLGTKAYYEALMKWQNQQKAAAQNPQKPCNGGMGGNQSSNSKPQSQSQNQPSSSLSPSKAPSNQAPEDNKDEEKESPSPSSQQEQESESQNKQDSNIGQQERGEKKEEQYPDGLAEVCNSFDSHDEWKEFRNLPEANKQLMQNNINSILKTTAEEVVKMRGTIPDNMKEIIEKLKKKKPEVFNWKAYFRRMLGSIYDVNIRTTRRKPSKRFVDSAGIQHKKKVSILVAVDTSGSVSNKELQDFFSEIEYIYKAGARVTIVECDARINKIEEYDGKKIPEIVGRGGTDFNPPVDYYVKHRKEYASLIYFTDGECCLPERKPSGMVWVITSNGMHQEYPGKAIYIPPTNNN